MKNAKVINIVTFVVAFGGCLLLMIVLCFTKSIETKKDDHDSRVGHGHHKRTERKESDISSEIDELEFNIGLEKAINS